MGKVKKQIYTLDMYLKKINEEDIRSDQDVQRMSGQWDKSMINELIATVVTGDYIPPVILGEEKNSQMWLIDGLQRSTSLLLFRYGNYKITSNVEQPVIQYRAKAKDKEGNILKDGNGNIIWENSEFDIRNKTYEKFPEELKSRFNEYQIETVIHEEYDMKRISKLIRRYNHHTAMNAAQKGFTFIENYAKEIRKILDGRFFVNCGKYTAKERINGTMERVVVETVMCMFHLDNWKKPSKQIGAYLNDNASLAEFKTLNANLNRLENIITEDLNDIFTSKDSFIWFTIFHKFTRLEIEDGKFTDFLYAFKNELSGKEVNGKFFYEVDKGRSTKDRTVIKEKLDILETLMCDYLHIDKGTDILEFVRKTVNPDITLEDMEQYEEVLNELTRNLDHASRLLENCNKPSLVAMVAWSFENDTDLDNWIVDYCRRNDDYISNQKENYSKMLDDLEKFMELTEVA